MYYVHNSYFNTKQLAGETHKSYMSKNVGLRDGLATEYVINKVNGKEYFFRTILLCPVRW